MNVGVIIGRIGGVDGVALETEKWITVLNRMGRKVFVLSGQYEDREMNADTEELLYDLSFFSPECLWEQSQAFFQPVKDPTPLMEHIETKSDSISKEIIVWILKNKINLLVVENASALPSHISMGVGIKKAVELLGIKTITHDHDFAWERGKRYHSPHKDVNDLIKKTFPLNLPSVVHAVINTPAQETLKEKFDIYSISVPNVMDFDIPYGIKTKENKNLPKDIGLGENDMMLFQVTRIVRRKGIEVAIDLLHKLKNKNLKLVITGNYNDDNDGGYANFLIDKIAELGLKKQVIFGSNFITHHIDKNNNGIRYNLSDAYAHAKACTYFSTYEGFGNAFIEAVVARKPIFVNNYKPVYWPDIGSKGFKTVMLENNNLTDDAIEQIKEIIYNEKLNKEIGEYNFELGRKYFSYDTLEKKLSDLINL
ncbi:MAG: glycosyltransferase family 4 protein, partial [Bacteroidota bacterium]|nr:glycosyltransferase family 4 protein [Bacteroidota bacterium]